jgi:hypothetical protein
MDWTKQTEELFKTWTAAQQRMMEGWFNAVKEYLPHQAAGDAWQQSLDAWRAEVQRALDAQLALVRTWSERMGAAEPGAANLSQQLPELMRHWTDAQRQIWERWAEAAKQATPPNMAALYSSDEAKQVLQSWQDATQKAVEAQLEWARSVTGQKRD